MGSAQLRASRQIGDPKRSLETGSAKLTMLSTNSSPSTTWPSAQRCSKGWVYEHIRSRGRPRSEQLPHIKVGKYIRFDPQARCAGLSRTNAEPRDSVPDTRYESVRGLNHEEPTGGKGVSRMARTKRQCGSGCLLKRRKGWAIRWREFEIAPDGTKQKVLAVRSARRGVTERSGRAAGSRNFRPQGRPGRSGRLVKFRTIATDWLTHLMPMYKNVHTKESSAHSPEALVCRILAM